MDAHQDPKSASAADAGLDEAAPLRSAAPRLTDDFLDAAPDAMVIVDGRGFITFLNAQMEHLVGYDRAEVLGKSLNIFLPERFRQRHAGHLEGFFSAPHARPMGAGLELFAVRKNGDEIPVEISLSPVQGVAQMLVIAAVHDVTGRKRTEETLRKSEGRYRSLFENMLDGIAYCRMLFENGRPQDFIYLDVNHAFEELTGLKNVVGRKVTDVIAGVRESSPELFERYGRVVLSGGPERFETYVEPLARWFSISAYRPEAGHFVAVFANITERKRAEQALRDGEAKFRDLVNEINDGLFASNDRGVITFANRTLATIHGFERPEQLLGRMLFEFIAPAALRDFREDFQSRVKSEKAGGFVTTTIVRQDGTEAVVEITQTPIVVATRIVGFRGVVRDVTERTRLEQQFRQAQKMEAIGRLAGGVAHDFNNLLTAIMGYGEMVLDELPTDSPVREDVQEIRKAADRAAALTRQLLAFSRKQILETRVLDLDALVGDVDNLLRRLLGEDIDLVTKLDPSLGKVRADPGQIEQVIVNLAVNARDAMPEGGKLTIETRNADLDETYGLAHTPVKPGHYVMFAVSDTGTGMSEETQAHLFEPFFTTKEKGKGTGLGLATVYGIVKQSDGYIWCYSELGHGTTFKVYLPLVEELAQKAAWRPTGKPARGWETVLLVEDEELVRTPARRALEAHGYQVLEATNGDEALALARRFEGPVHLLVTDVVLPGVSGRKLAEGILTLRPDTRVLYMSGYTDDAIVHRGVLDPNTPFLHKPFTPDALAHKVREVLDGTASHTPPP